VNKILMAGAAIAGAALCASLGVAAGTGSGGRAFAEFAIGSPSHSSERDRFTAVIPARPCAAERRSPRGFGRQRAGRYQASGYVTDLLWVSRAARRRRLLKALSVHLIARHHAPYRSLTGHHGRGDASAPADPGTRLDHLATWNSARSLRSPRKSVPARCRSRGCSPGLWSRSA
jgi:hypothetical protein